MAYQLTLVLVFYFFMPTYIYLNVNICSMHICTRGPQMSWIQKMQFHFSKSNFLVPKIFDFKMKISVIPHLSSIFGTMAHNLCSNSNVQHRFPTQVKSNLGFPMLGNQLLQQIYSNREVYNSMQKFLDKFPHFSSTTCICERIC